MAIVGEAIAGDGLAIEDLAVRPRLDLNTLTAIKDSWTPCFKTSFEEDWHQLVRGSVALSPLELWLPSVSATML